jgi:hypothetical protein
MGGGEQPTYNNMKTIILRAVTPAIVAIAAILLSFRFLCVVGLGAVMALDYRVTWKRWFGR